MKKFLLIFLIVILVLGLLIGGIVFALSPPFPVVAPQQSEPDELEPSANAYLMEKVAAALDDYSGEGDMEIVLDEAGLSQAVADALAPQIDLPKTMKYTGAFVDVNQEYIQIGSGFKFLIFPVGVSTRLQAEVHDGNLHLAVKSASLGRIPLPLHFVLKVAGKYANLPAEISTLSFSVPLSDAEDDSGPSISGLELQAEQLVLSVQADASDFAAIDDEVLEDLEKVQPKAEAILKDNPQALKILEEIESLIEDAKAEGKTVNPVSLSILGEKFYNSLSDDEIQELRDILDDDTIEFLEENMDWSIP